MTAEKNTLSAMDFLEMQAAVGITKHMGGLAATNEPLSLCHIREFDITISKSVLLFVQDKPWAIQECARVTKQGRIEWIGWRWLLRAWGRGLRLYITDPAVRQPIREMFNVPAETFEYVGYGLFAGKK